MAAYGVKEKWIGGAAGSELVLLLREGSYRRSMSWRITGRRTGTASALFLDVVLLPLRTGSAAAATRIFLLVARTAHLTPTRSLP